jgi:SAM-dependent methyltransferase
MTEVAAGVAALPGTHDAVFALVRDLPPSLLLDAPCGHGALSALLQRGGHRVVAADLRPGALPRAIMTVGLDLNASLPFRDSVFDAVVAVEGIEHLENLYLPVREFYRVLRPHGVLIVTTPNILSLRSRLKFLLFGTFFWFDESGYRRGGHVNAIPVYELRYILVDAGFVVERLGVNRRRAVAWLAAKSLAPCLRMLARLRAQGTALNGPDLLAGEVLVVRARKPDGLRRA